MIGLTGYYGFGNPGDDLSLQNTIRFYGGRGNVAVFTPRVQACYNLIGKCDAPVYSVNMLPKLSRKLSLLLFAGGDVIHDLSLETLWPKHIIRKVKCPIGLAGVGIPHGEGYTLASKRIRYLADKIVFAGFRDFNSMSIYSELTGKPACFVPDPVFLTEKKECERDGMLVQFKPRLYEYERLYPSNYADAERMAKQYLRNGGKRVFWDGLHPESAVDAVAHAEGVVGVSLHLGSIALSQEVPFKLFQYQGKTKSVMDVAACSQHVVRNAEYSEPLPVREHERTRFLLLKDYLRGVLKRLGEGEYWMPNPPITPCKAESFRFGGMPERRRLRRKLRNFVHNRLYKFNSAS